MNTFIPWDIRVTIDLFLGGVGVGSYLVALFSSILGNPYNSLKKIAAVISSLAVCTGLLFLIFELGRPERFITTLFRNNATSVMSWGVYLQAIFVILAIVYAFLVLKRSDERGVGPWVKWLGGLFAVAVGLYHGFLLSSNVSSALWNNGALPVMFFISSLLTGIALVIVVSSVIPAGLTNKAAVQETAVNMENNPKINFDLINIILLILQLFAIFSWMFSMSRGTEKMALNYDYLLTNYGMQWWLGVIAVGLILPLLLSLYNLNSGKKENASSTITTVTAIFILIGGFVLKNVILAAGQMNYPLF